MSRVRVELSGVNVSENRREYALLQQLGDGTGEFDAQARCPRTTIKYHANMSFLKLAGGQYGSVKELSQFQKYGDKGKVEALQGDISFPEFTDAFKKPATNPELEGAGDCIGWCTTGPKEPLKPWRFPRRAAGPSDVVLQITYSGMCHSDVHQCRNEWANSSYPMVPGHEILGVVVETGSEVKRFKVGDYAAVGCMVDTCMACSNCNQGDEQYCLGLPEGPVMTYNSRDKEGNPTYGGYSSHVVCLEHFVFSIDRSMHEPGTAPLLCAGITTYEPMKVFGVDKPGMKVGVVGLGGLGHMAVKFAKAFEQHCTVLSRSYKKQPLALELGADHFVAMSDADAVAGMGEKLDAIIDTVDGQLILVGAPERPHQVSAWNVLARRRAIRGSFIGGVPRTQQMLDFCKEEGIRCDVEVIDVAEVNTAFDRMVSGDVKFRFVIDVLQGIISG